MYPTINSIIPPIIHSLENDWRQPPLDQIQIQDECAIMTWQTLQRVQNYSLSPPSAYAGKVWRSTSDGGTTWTLWWYGFGDEFHSNTVNTMPIKVVKYGLPQYALRLSFWQRIRIWYRANFKNDQLWRVNFPRGERTRLLFFREAHGLAQVCDGMLWIDYQADKRNPRKRR